MLEYRCVGRWMLRCPDCTCRRGNVYLSQLASVPNGSLPFPGSARFMLIRIRPLPSQSHWSFPFPPAVSPILLAVSQNISSFTILKTVVLPTFLQGSTCCGENTFSGRRCGWYTQYSVRNLKWIGKSNLLSSQKRAITCERRYCNRS